MGKSRTISILVFFVSATAFGVMGAHKTLLRDGFVLRGVDGKLAGKNGSEGWLFKFDSDVSDGRGIIKAGTAVELLPSAVLEKMTAEMQTHSAANPVRSKLPGAATVPPVQTSNVASYRLWGRITRYKGRNFIFPVYFLPLSKAEPPAQTQKSQQQKEALPTINEPGDAVSIPDEIIAKLQSGGVARPEQLSKGLIELKPDFVLTDRTGFISSAVSRPFGFAQDRDAYHVNGKREKEKENTQYDFVLDGLGRGLQRVWFALLPCEALERAERTQSAEPEPVRFKATGIATKYKGEYYLLLQKAARVYSYGNFPR